MTAPTRTRAALGLAAVAVLCAWASLGQTAGAKLTVATLSSRADMVSGGDVLVEITSPAGLADVRLTAGGKDV